MTDQPCPTSVRGPWLVSGCANLIVRSMAAAVLMLSASRAASQSLAPSLLQIDVHDHTVYVFDGDRSQWATSRTKLTRQPPKTFESWVGMGDIVSVNGTPMKGSVFESSLTISAAVSPTPGQAIADSQRSGLYQWNLDFLKPDGTSLGAVQISGIAGGMPPPGVPSSIDHANYVVVGGTGAFLGVHGYFNSNMDATAPVRPTSAVEDPAYRRANGGGTVHLLLYLLPALPPQSTAFYHADLRPVTLLNPAQPGETIVARVIGLGAVRPAVDPGQPFPSDAAAIVNAPLGLTVSDQPTEVLKAVGWPGTSDIYGVYFRVPAGLPSGDGTVRISVAWMWGPASQMQLGGQER